ncbi:uncharacterized protein LOC106081934 [Stomoxys calcitrans]|uniref:Uncharacterized protein n=1 Tax=Stomoxys calcitrans TaxID=35570 RepID=A0A1I8PDW1_STOCA|nr:uncharacterized protein LOC106081934 [Stomoxys calcitrans]
MTGENTNLKSGQNDVEKGFTSSQGQLLVGEQKYTVRALKMNGATMVFLSASEPECLDEMAVAMKMPQDGQIIGTTILGAQSITDSQRLAEQFTRRYGRQFFVSFNVNVDRMTAPLLDKELSAYMNNNQELFI